MMKRWVLGVALAAVSLQAHARDATEAEIKLLRESLAETLLDAESARFRSVRVAEDGTVCGLVNAKNAMAAYVGFRPFLGMVVGPEGTTDGSSVAIVLKIDDDGPVAAKMCADRGLM